jgi:hypothetical protein
MKKLALLVLLAACAGSRDAPRPIGPNPLGQQQVNDVPPMNDDDGDGIPNEMDRCPEASEKITDPVRDGCPTFPDAGIEPIDKQR